MICPHCGMSIITNKRGVFVPPSIEEIQQYCTEKDYDIDAEKFHAYYESNGWMVGRNKMKSWQAAITTWRRNNAGRKASGSGGRTTGRDFGQERDEIRKRNMREAFPELCEPSGEGAVTPTGPNAHHTKSRGNENLERGFIESTIVEVGEN